MKSIIALIAVLGAGAIFFLYTQPAYDNTKMQSAQIAQYNAALDKAAELQQLKQSLLSRYNAFDPNALGRLQKLLPDHVDNIALILDLDSIASRYGLALQNVDISTSGNAVPTATAIGAVGSASQTYGSLTMNFTTQGTYDNFLKFITDLESSLRIVDLVSLTITPSSITRAGVSQSAYTYNITLRTYWLK